MVGQSNKTAMARVRLTPSEDELFTRFALDNGTDKSKLQRKIIREIITTRPHLLAEEMQIFRDAVRNISGIARNLNQLTKLANSGRIPARLFEESYYMHLREEIGALREKLDSVIDSTENRWV